MLKRLLRIGLPAALLVCLGYYWGRQSAVSQTADGESQLGSESALGAPKATPGLRQPDGLPAVFAGTADEFLKALYLEKSKDETNYLLFHTVQHSPLERVISWTKELISMPPDQPWYPEFMVAVGNRWGAADPVASMAWARSLKHGRQQWYASTLILRGIAQKDSALALAKFKELPEIPHQSSILAGIADSIRKTDPIQAVELLIGNHSQQAGTVISDAFSNIARTDPATALKLAAKFPPFTADDAIVTIFTAWGRTDPTAAMAAAKGVPNALQKSHALSAAFNSWLASDPNAALAQISSLPQSMQSNVNIGFTLGRMADRGWEEAIALFYKLPPSLQKKQIGAFVSMSSETDPEGALSWVLSLPPDNALRADALLSVIPSLFYLPAARREAAIESIPPGKERLNTVQAIVSRYSSVHPKIALEMLMKLEPHHQARLFNTCGLMEGLMKIDTDLAVKFGAQYGTQGNGNSLPVGLQKIAELDYPKAEKYFATLPPALQLKAMPGLYGTLALVDGPAAMAKVNAIQDQSARYLTVRSVLNSWAQQDPDAVIAWAQMAPTEERLLAQQLAFQLKLKNDTVSTLPALTALLNADQARTDARQLSSLATQAVDSLYRDDPKAAGEWAMQLVDESVRREAVGTIAYNWANDDPVKAGVWIRSLPSGNAKDTALQNLTRIMQATDPASAFALALSIQHEYTRTDSVSRAFRAWKLKDPAAAEQALQSAPLSEADRASILRQ